MKIIVHVLNFNLFKQIISLTQLIDIYENDFFKYI